MSDSVLGTASTLMLGPRERDEIYLLEDFIYDQAFCSSSDVI